MSAPLSRTSATLNSDLGSVPCVTANKALWRNKGKAGATDEDASSSSGGSRGLGNVLESVTLKPKNLSSLAELQPQTLTQQSVGQVKAFSSQALQAFKNWTIPGLIQKEFSATTRPATVVRSVTLKVKNLIDQSKGNSSEASRTVLNGPSGSGKSVVMLQGLAYAQATGWIVLYLPSGTSIPATPLVNSSTPHVYSPQRALFDQPQFAAQFLQRIAQTNKTLLTSLKTTQPYELTADLPIGTSLYSLITQSSPQDRIAPLLLEALFFELSRQTSHPVLLAIDQAQGLFNTTQCVDPTYRKLEAHDLSLPRLLLDYVGGVKNFVRSGHLYRFLLRILTSALRLSQSNGLVLISPSHQSTTTSPALEEHLSSSPYPSYTPLGPSHQIYSSLLSSVRQLPVPARLEKQEALGIVDLLMGFRAVREVGQEGVDDGSFMKALMESDARVREFRKGWERNQAI
ncbi:BZ3500_MvSof-1268-A1-R1_Chr6-2g08483 [Microbotryum saponariae]|uniref:Small ribosomal subunit protein mS29 n=1 Tax=Microbotryum saponariae TaxID=289078 RepID=A0A2X0MMS4_9BASI|nr:BZ3500_MvSof-1268-A1-R1_Chr6-2g08483 [Microbotryum saponariae]SDA07760.1 BZ3501_MvSof-1269-A2-R1_Chr6-1g08197 [Microbotryum saponariae]